MSRYLKMVFYLFISLVCAACNFPFAAKISTQLNSEPPTALAVAVGAVSTTVSTPTDVPTAAAATPVLGPTLVPSPTMAPASPSPTATPFVELTGCQQPPDTYTRMIVNGAKLDYRTVWMLRHAQNLYRGAIDSAGWVITQGSYNPGGVAASFGTHDGGGAVDLSVINPRNGQVLRDELPDAIRALRITGFAAWVREPSELYSGSPIHIHAIAIGDAELSQAAQDQLTGTFGYFRGYNGLPQKNNMPIPDRHGGPILCQWMIDMGYRDLRNQ